MDIFIDEKDNKLVIRVLQDDKCYSCIYKHRNICPLLNYLNNEKIILRYNQIKIDKCGLWKKEKEGEMWIITKNYVKSFIQILKKRFLTKKVATSIMKVINSIRHSNYPESIKQEHFRNLYNRLLVK